MSRVSSNPARRHQGAATTPGSSTSSGRGSIQGVLWKRRDVFRNGWRPRWFVLHPQEAILTYYLLNENAQPTSTLTTHVATSSPTNRNRTDSDFSMDTMDYDVIPRGSIFLGGASCSAKANDKLTRPEEHLYTIEISDGQHSTSSFLAARTSTDRDRWLEKIQQVIHQHQVQPPNDHPVTSEQSTETEHTVPTVSSEPPIVRPVGDSAAEPSSGWSTMDTPRLLENVPEDVAARIQSMLQTYLPQASTEEHPEWTFSYSNNDLRVYRRRTPPMVRSIYKTTHSHPAEYLRLLWDLPRVVEFQPNIRCQELLHSYNAHTNLVYTAYNPVWPTSARDFCSVVHWRLLRNQNGKRALCILAFSSPHAESMRPIPNDHVRGILNLSLNLWTPTSSGDGYLHTRILSYDMNGSIPQQITQSIMQQQASLPRQLDLFLRRTKRENSKLSLLMEYEALYHYLHMAPEESVHHFRLPNIKEDRSTQQLPSEIRETVTSSEESSKAEWTLRSILLLLAPVFLPLAYQCFGKKLFGMFLFLCLALVCLRWVVLQRLLEHYSVLPGKTRGLIASWRGNCSCQFTVELDGVSKYLESKGKNMNFDVSAAVDHLIFRAVSRAMTKHKSLLIRSVPFLPPLYNMGIRWQASSENNSCFTDIWLPQAGVSQQSLKDVATAFVETKAPATKREWQHVVVGDSCRVLKTEIDLGVSLSKAPNESVLILLSMYPPPKRKGRNSNESMLHELAHTTRLHVWVIANGADVEQECRSFAEDLRVGILRPT